MRAALGELMDRHDFITDVRGMGLLNAVEFDREMARRDPYGMQRARTPAELHPPAAHPHHAATHRLRVRDRHGGGATRGGPRRGRGLRVGSRRGAAVVRDAVRAGKYRRCRWRGEGPKSPVPRTGRPARLCHAAGHSPPRRSLLHAGRLVEGVLRRGVPRRGLQHVFPHVLRDPRVPYARVLPA